MAFYCVYLSPFSYICPLLSINLRRGNCQVQNQGKLKIQSIFKTKQNKTKQNKTITFPSIFRWRWRTRPTSSGWTRCSASRSRRCRTSRGRSSSVPLRQVRVRIEPISVFQFFDDFAESSSGGPCSRLTPSCFEMWKCLWSLWSLTVNPSMSCHNLINILTPFPFKKTNTFKENFS